MFLTDDYGLKEPTKDENFKIMLVDDLQVRDVTKFNPTVYYDSPKIVVLINLSSRP